MVGMDGIGGPGGEGGRPPRLGFREGQPAAAGLGRLPPNQALLLAGGRAGGQGEGVAGTGGNRGHFLRDAASRDKGGARGRNVDVDPSIDPFSEEMETERQGGFLAEGYASSMRSQQLQLGTWSGTSGTLHAVSRGGSRLTMIAFCFVLIGFLTHDPINVYMACVQMFSGVCFELEHARVFVLWRGSLRHVHELSLTVDC